MKKGFTLIELMVVISIISLLSSVALTAFQDARASARDAERFQTGRAVETALELYHLMEGEYPGVEGDSYEENSPGYQAVMGLLLQRSLLSEIPESLDGETYTFIRLPGRPPVFAVRMEKQKNIPANQNIFITYFHGGDFGSCELAQSITGGEEVNVTTLLELLEHWEEPCGLGDGEVSWCVQCELICLGDPDTVGIDELLMVLNFWGDCSSEE